MSAPNTRESRTPKVKSCRPANADCSAASKHGAPEKSACRNARQLIRPKRRNREPGQQSCCPHELAKTSSLLVVEFQGHGTVCGGAPSPQSGGQE